MDAGLQMILPSTAPASGSARVEHGDGQTGVEQVVNWVRVRDKRNTQKQTGEGRRGGGRRGNSADLIQECTRQACAVGRRSG